MPSDLDLMRVQADTLFRHDEHGRMLMLNEQNGAPAPRLFLGRTQAGNLWRFRSDLPDSLVRDLERLLRTEPTSADLRHPPVAFEALQRGLEAHSPIARTWMGPAWRFPAEIEPPDGVIEVVESNAAVLRANFSDLVAELPERRPCLAVVQGGDAVSVCFSARTSAEASEAGVETHPAFRGHGYATAVVAAWCLAVRGLGRLPLYSTSWNNLPSQRVAGKLGLVLYGADLWLA